MTLFHRVNQSNVTGADAIFLLKTVLKEAGWTVTSSGTGTGAGGSYSASGDIITTVADFTTRPRAWFVIQEPSGSGGRQWCWQRGTNNVQWRVKISPTQGFTGGTPNLDTVPSATDEAIIHGGGTDANPGSTGWLDTTGLTAALFDTDNTYSLHIVADDTPVGPLGNQVYQFWLATVINTNYPRTLVCQEPLAVGTYTPLVGTRISTTSGDADPAMYACRPQVDNRFFFEPGPTTNFNSETTQTFRYFHNYTSGAHSGLTFAHDVLLGDNATPELSTTPINSQDVILPIYIGRQGSAAAGWTTRTTLVGYKGCLNNIKRRSISRAVGTTITT